MNSVTAAETVFPEIIAVGLSKHFMEARLPSYSRQGGSGPRLPSYSRQERSGRGTVVELAPIW